MLKFVFPDDEVKHFNRFAACVDALNEYEDCQFVVYYIKPFSGEWIFAFRHLPGIYCECGRSYYDTPNGTLFACRDVDLIYRHNMQEFLDLLKTKPLCYYCYYTKEYKAGRFVPRAFRIDFEKNNLYNE